jgi:hypothetical protein
LEVNEMSENVIALREALRNFLGNDRFKAFVDLNARKFNLKPWQKDAWNDFVGVYPEFKHRLDDLPAAVRVCKLHGDELASGTVPIVRSRVAFLTRLLTADLRRATEYYPEAESGPHFAGDTTPGDVYQVWYCPTCREREVEWKTYSSEGKESDEDDDAT